ncbi:MAG: hypothetical protein ACOC4B_03040 [Bacteroidota bacterium]
MQKIDAYSFYNAWVKTVNSRKNDIKNKWYNFYEYTNLVLSSDNCLLNNVANILNLNLYPNEYYSLDAVFYSDNDRIQKIIDTPENLYWFYNIKVAIEHENCFNIKLYQEVSHLLITDCDLKVLITYPNSINQRDQIIDSLYEIVKKSKRCKEISDKASFIIINGYNEGSIWDGYIFREDKWEII